MQLRHYNAGPPNLYNAPDSCDMTCWQVKYSVYTNVTTLTLIQNYQMVKHKNYEVPLHTLLAASAEVLPLQLSMLVVMVTMLLLMMMEVQIVRPGRTGAGRALRSSVNNVFCWALVDYMWVVTNRGAVVVLFRQMLGERGDQILLLRHADKTRLGTHTQKERYMSKNHGFLSISHKTIPDKCFRSS